MSTYYQFRCPKCSEIGGFFSRQAWGWGNCDLFDNFKFFVAHSDCGSVEILSEHDDGYFNSAEELAWLEHLDEDTHLRDNVWPHANEWQAVADSWPGSHAQWREDFDAELKREREGD